MTNHTRILRSTAVGAAAAIALLLLSATPALAAKPAGKANNSPSSHGGSSSTPTGNDISYPQCGGTFPSGQAFGIVGVNDGLANNLNPCLGPDGGGASTSELYWAQTTSSGAVNQQGGSQPTAGLYVNTADPSNAVSDWPTAGTYAGDPYSDSSTAGYCDGGNTQACAWAYGDSKAVQDGQWLEAAATAVNTALATAGSSYSLPTSPSSYPWWLDIQTANSWQSGTNGLAMNGADIQGMLAGLDSFGSTSTGIYSTSYQWGQIVGSPSATTFPTLPDWIPGARKLSQAESNCSLAGFTGPVAVTQWFGHPYDGDYACP
ncbi:MAG: hypothetical protein ACYCYK_09710 [Candidatus Dormibacteria bacterium]